VSVEGGGHTAISNSAIIYNQESVGNNNSVSGHACSLKRFLSKLGEKIALVACDQNEVASKISYVDIMYNEE